MTREDDESTERLVPVPRHARGQRDRARMGYPSCPACRWRQINPPPWSSPDPGSGGTVERWIETRAQADAARVLGQPPVAAAVQAARARRGRLRQPEERQPAAPPTRPEPAPRPGDASVVAAVKTSVFN